MKIEMVKRPWQKGNGQRFNPDPFYQSQAWKSTRKAFIAGQTTLPNGMRVSNTLCIECFLKGVITPMYVVDHKVRIKDGGDRTDLNNLQSLCESHHNSKSANEGNSKK